MTQSLTRLRILFCLLLVTSISQAQNVSFSDTGDTLLIRNPDTYELGILKINGAITHLDNLASGETILKGSIDQNLWEIGFADDTWLHASDVERGFSYSWSEQNTQLTLTYAENQSVSVEVVITAKQSNYLDFNLSFTNNNPETINRVSFPHTLKVNELAIRNGLFPDKPGVMLSADFFANLSHTGKISGIHPPAMADYLGLQTTSTTIAMYPLWGTQKLQITTFSFGPVDETSAGMSHGFIVWRPSGFSWKSVPVRIRLADSYEETIHYYRLDNSIDQYDSVEEKLGSKYKQLINSPYISFPCDWNGPATGWYETFKTMYAPALLLVMGYYSGGFHGYFPDVIPPDPALGSLEEFKAAMDSAHAYGLMTMPMILPNWWHENSPTILNLGNHGLTVDSIAEIDQDGNLAYYFWELAGRQDFGYGVTPRHPYVQNRLAELMNTLTNEVGFDMVYEDVIGASNASNPNFNVYAPDTLDTEGWLDHTRTYQDLKLWTETGSDLFAETEVGFLGGGHGPDWTNMPNSKAWPMSGFLLKDKVLRYHYWGGVDKETIAWNLAFGYMLSIQLDPAVGDGYPESGWFTVLHKFQTKILSKYVDQLLNSYAEISGSGLLKFEYDSMNIIANPDTVNNIVFENHTLSPGGVLAFSPDRKIVGGIFSSFNNQALDGEDQFLIIEQHSDSIEVSHPRGLSTSLTINMHPNWNENDTLWAKAYTREGEYIDALAVSNDTISCTFNCLTRFQGRPVDHYQIVKGGLPPEPNWNIYCHKERNEDFILGNRNFYEIHVADYSTALVNIIDKTSGDTLSSGSEWGRLWGISYPNAPSDRQFLDPISSFVPWHTFSLEKAWSQQDSTLTFHYVSDSLVGVEVTVTITISSQNYFDMQMSLENHWGYMAQNVSFPHHLVFETDSTSSALLPFDYPGMRLKPSFFTNQKNYVSAYPSRFMADLFAYQNQGGNLTMYGMWEKNQVLNTQLGLLSDIPNRYVYEHNYGVSIEDGESWTSPVFRIRVGQSSVESLQAFRRDNNIDNLANTLITKMDSSLFNSLCKSPLFFTYHGDFDGMPFKELAGWAQQLPSPSIMRISNFHPGGRYGLHPDILPPGNEWGTEAEFISMTEDLQSQGKLLMPYTIPFWWDENSSTLQSLPSSTIEEIALKQHDGGLARVSFNGLDFGYLVSPGYEAVKDRIAANYTSLKGRYQADFIFEDHQGSTYVNIDYNRDYHVNWLGYAEHYRDSTTIISDGFDRLFPNIVGNAASIYYEPENGVSPFDYDFGDSNWEYYPVTPLIFHDQYIPYQPENYVTSNKAILSWNMLFGVGLSYQPDLSDLNLSETDPWLRVLNLFQSKAISAIIGKKMTDYYLLSEDVAVSKFEDVFVLRNASLVSDYSFDNKHEIAALGAWLLTDDGHLEAGIFTSYNNEVLSPGDHYLLIEKTADSIKVTQAMGLDTPIAIARPGNWMEESRIHVFGITSESQYELSKTIDHSAIHFDLDGLISGERVDYYLVFYDDPSAYVDQSRFDDREGGVHCYPNPVKNALTISLLLPQPSPVEIKIFSHSGQQVYKILYHMLPEGSHEFIWRGVDEWGSHVSKGVYIVKVYAKDLEKTIKTVWLSGAGT